jgi:hypothetical protein
MRTLIRADQLNPDVSGLVWQYTRNLYPNYSDIVLGSGLNYYVNSQDEIVISAYPILNSGIVRSINGVTNQNVFITGLDGINFSFLNNTGFISMDRDAMGVNSINTLSGDISIQGGNNISIEMVDSHTIRVNHPVITGVNNAITYYSGGKINIDALSIKSVNGISGECFLTGISGARVYNSGNYIVINGYDSKYYGVYSLNNLSGNISLFEGSDIGIVKDTLTNSFTVSYIGHGFGTNNIGHSGNNNYSWDGSNNYIDSGCNLVHAGGNNNFIQNSDNINLTNSNNNDIYDSDKVSLINSHNNNVDTLKNATLVNCDNVSDAQNGGYYVGNIGMSNSYFGKIEMSAKITGNVGYYPLIEQSSSGNGIFIETGSILIGHIDYIGVDYNITDPYASFRIDQGIYGRKYFVAQRDSSLSTSIKDQADLFGGGGIYDFMISGGNDGKIYFLGSGYQEPTGRMHKVLMKASIQYNKFAMDFDVV